MKSLFFTICLTVVVNFVFGQFKVVAPDGNVVIGKISTPTEKLEVSENLKVRGNYIIVGSDVGSDLASVKIGKGRTENGSALFDLVSRNDGEYGIRFASFSYGVASLAHRGTKQMVIRTNSPNAPIWFKTGGEFKNRLVVASNGNVGVNTNNPAVDFEVQGLAAKPGGGDWIAVADKNLKENIYSYDMGLSEILKLNPVYYNYNGKGGIKDTETKHVGLIAQEFQEIAPQAVKRLKYQEIINEGEDKAFKTGETLDYLAIDGSSIRYMLVNAVKEQQEFIEYQDRKITELNNTVSGLENMVSQLVEKVNNLTNSDLSIDLMRSGKTLELYQNTPNPVKNTTKIKTFIPTHVIDAHIKIQDLNGKLIKKVAIQNRGFQTLVLSVNDFAPGLYTYTLESDGTIVSSKKMLVE